MTNPSNLHGDQQSTTEMGSSFAGIFHSAEWDATQRSRSGPGSWPELTVEYRRILQDCLRRLQVRSVVDIGCGDWASSRHIYWSGISYLGVDVVPDLIEWLNATYGSDHVRFSCADAVRDDLPTADLAIAKDVLQHWPNHAVQALLPRLSRFRYALVTNDRECVVPGDWRSLWLPRRVGRLNDDIPIGGWRPLDLLSSPFRLRAERLARLRVPVGHGVFIKDVLLWANPSAVRA